MSIFFENETDELDTFSGKRVNIISPQQDTFNIEDIARGLSFGMRYTATDKMLSIAQHSLFVSEIARLFCDKFYYFLNLSEQEKNDLIFASLHHDDSEAYLRDIPKMLKKNLPEYKKIELNLEEHLFKFLGLNTNIFPLVKLFDILAVPFEIKKIFKHIDVSNNIEKMSEYGIEAKIFMNKKSNIKEIFIQKHLELLYGKHKKSDLTKDLFYIKKTNDFNFNPELLPDLVKKNIDEFIKNRKTFNHHKKMTNSYGQNMNY